MSDQYHYKMEESEAGEYPLYKGDVYYGDILLFDNAKDLMRALTQTRKEVVAGPDLIVFPGDKIDFTNELGTVSRRVIVKAGPENEEVDISYEVIQDDQPVAGASGPTALAEARNYAAQYAQDGPVEIVEVRRKVIDKLEKS